MSAVPVLYVRSLGAKRVGVGRGKLVRKGLVLREALRASSAVGGQIRVMSVIQYESNLVIIIP